MRILLLLCLLPTLASAQVSKMFVPAWASLLPSNMTNGLTLYCARVVPELTITNATKLVGSFTGSACSDTMTFALYEDTDDTSTNHLIASASGFVCGAGGTIKATGIPAFTLTAGTPIRACVCGTSTTLSYQGIQQASQCCEEFNLTQLLQAFTPANLGTGQSCTGAAVPPAATGTLTADTTSPGRNQKKIPLVLVEQ